MQRRTNLRERQKLYTRSRLLEAAVEVFAERGYEDATIDEIAGAAGASRATFYLHFKSKPELAAALFANVRPDIEAYYSTLDSVLATGSQDALRQWVRDALGWFRDHETVMLAFEHVMLGTRGGADPNPIRFTEHMPGFLASWPPERRAEAELRVWMLVLMLGRVQFLWGSLGQMPEASEDLVVAALADLWTMGLALPAHAEPL